MNKLRMTLCAAAVAIAPLSPAVAAVFVIDAANNSISGGTGLSTIALSAGQIITVSASTSDLWSAGALPRYSDADGLVGPRIASPSDDSGPQDGTTVIGANFGLPTINGFTAPFGSLVGLVGTEYQLLGTNFTGSFTSAGTLQLFYWDTNNGDNFGTIAANVASLEDGAVPEPATWLMMLAGFGAVGVAFRRRRVAITSAV